MTPADPAPSTAPTTPGAEGTSAAGTAPDAPDLGPDTAAPSPYPDDIPAGQAPPQAPVSAGVLPAEPPPPPEGFAEIAEGPPAEGFVVGEIVRHAHEDDYSGETIYRYGMVLATDSAELPGSSIVGWFDAVSVVPDANLTGT